jgi:hypothetical protein
MRWLGGAHEIKENFLHAPMDQNVVLSFLHWKRTAIDAGNAESMSLNVYSDSLEPFARWYELLRTLLFRDGKCEVPVSTCVYPRDHLAGTFVTSPLSGKESLQMNIRANIPRTDLLPEPGLSFLELAGDSDVISRQCAETGLGVSGVGPRWHPLCGFDLVVPEIDTFALGQLFQLFLIETEVERQLCAT